jgi:hypothetical protein
MSLTDLTYEPFSVLGSHAVSGVLSSPKFRVNANAPEDLRHPFVHGVESEPFHAYAAADRGCDIVGSTPDLPRNRCLQGTRKPLVGDRVLETATAAPTNLSQQHSRGGLPATAHFD